MPENTHLKCVAENSVDGITLRSAPAPLDESCIPPHK